MLCISLKPNQSFNVGQDVRVKMLSREGTNCHLRIHADERFQLSAKQGRIFDDGDSWIVIARIGQKVKIGGDITVVVVERNRSAMMFAVEAPRHLKVFRNKSNPEPVGSEA